MNCEQFRSVMLDLVRDADEPGSGERLGAETLKEALEHADGCRACDDLLEEAEAITASLREIAAEHAVEQASSRVEKTLLRALAVRRTLAAHSALRRRIMLGAAASVAAMVLMAIPVIWHRVAPVAHVSRTPQSTSGPLGKDSVASPAIVASGSVGGSRTLGESQAAWLSGFGDDEKITNSFVPLSQTFDPELADDDTVVRVVLSRAALDSFGLHLDQANDSKAGDQVVADLIVTNDGTPQAIRVVGW